ncbi:MAG: SDR family NAD(P)-dependent oxidoreductase [Spirochaetales bacterium]|nr:SDR family NAD(P)-dependent oxidoreductase [Candidatus Physcosoma equi]
MARSVRKEVYVVTGGGSGIGKAIASLLPSSSLIILADRSLERLEAVVAVLSSTHPAIKIFSCDVAKREEVRRLAEYASSLGMVKKVFHCAGVSGSMSNREAILRINALGTVYVNQEFFRVMDGGVICDFASNSGYILPSFLMPSERVYRTVLKDEELFLKKMYHRTSLIPLEKWNRQLAYLVSKNFARWYAQKCSFRYMEEKGIRVFSISPGFVKTPMTEAEKGFLSANILSFSAMNRGAEPEELASLAILLSDERCGSLLGTDVLADGGCIGNHYGLLTCFHPFRRRHVDEKW